MKTRTFAGTAAALLALVLAVFVGPAAGGNGNGSPPPTAQGTPPASPGNSASAPGQVSQTSGTQAAQPTQKAAPSHPAPAKSTVHKTTQTSHATTHTSHATTHTSHAPVQSTSAPGTKPSSTTAKRTHYFTGNSPDTSKRYGNGKTAGQIATGNGAPSGTDVFGPGNSQPHKVYNCRHPLHGGGGGVDVHAVKDYTVNCSTQQSTTQPQVSVQASCPAITVQTTHAVGFNHIAGKSGKVVVVHANAHSAHATKHADTAATATQTQVIPTGNVCSSATQSTQQLLSPAQVQVLLAQTRQAAAAAQQQTSAATAQQQTAAGAAGQQASSPSSAGGVLGAQATLKSKSQPKGGVLGAVARIAGTSLPFTGLSLWIAVAIGAALLAAGALLYRRAHGTSRA